jgi:hypothetical protein
MNKIYTILTALLLTLSMYAQSPEAINYQAIVRDGSGNIIANQNIGVQMSILQTTATGTVIFSETFTKTSNGFGLINLAIGTGTATTGTFAGIDWSNGPYFVRTAVDVAGGSSYVEMGTSQLLSVPYALYAENSGDSKWLDGTNTGIGYFGGTVGIGTLDALPTSTLLVVDDSAGNINNIRVQNVNVSGVTRINVTNDNNTEMVFGINNSASSFGANEAFLWYFDNFDFKIGIGGFERLRIKNTTGNIEVKTGDVYIENIGSGAIMKSPNGNCWRMTVSDAGLPVVTSIPCP